VSTYSRNNRFQHSPARRTRAHQEEQGFTCRHCGLYVTCAPTIAGVQNRNHCPYCLWSRHLDGLSAGDRLAGCRATMQPIGLTTKRSRNKYASESSGELMLIHRCTVCAKIVINRIAADDSAAAIMALFEESYADGARQAELEASGVAILSMRDALLVRRRLFGNSRAEPQFSQEAA
jgi:hypothetical protein